jgi:hypothetical protein
VKPSISAAAATLAPSLGPAIVTIAGIDIPVLALGLSLASLFLARLIAPPPLRKLNRQQEIALTGLLMIFLFLVVTGNLPLVGTGEPLGVGMAVVWGIGLGFSGLTIVELTSRRVLAMVRAAFGESGEQD